MKVQILDGSVVSNLKTYPWIGEYEGSVVLFTAPRTGLRIYSSGDTSTYHSNWTEHWYKPFTGRIILEN